MKTKKNKNGVRQPVTPIGVTFDNCNSLFMILLFIVMAYPFLYVISYSFSTPAKIITPLLIFPQGFTLKAYVTLFSDPEFFHSLLIRLLIKVPDIFSQLFLVHRNGERCCFQRIAKSPLIVVQMDISGKNKARLSFQHKIINPA